MYLYVVVCAMCIVFHNYDFRISIYFFLFLFSSTEITLEIRHEAKVTHKYHFESVDFHFYLSLRVFHSKASVISYNQKARFRRI